MKKITFLLMAIMVSAMSWSQCVQTEEFGTYTSANDGGIQTMSTCHYTVEYSNISGLIPGDDYSIALTDNTGGANNYVTITDVGDVPIAHGPTPFTWTATVTDVRFHWSDDEFCATSETCHTGTLQNLTIASSSCLDPTDIEVTNLAETSADITWESGGSTSEVDFNVEVYLLGESAAGSDTPVFANANATGTTINATGLSQSTTYDVYITANCSGAISNSDLVGPVSFTTLGPAPANDECANAETIVCGGQYVGSTINATPEDPDPGTCTTTAGTAGAVWYTFTGANSDDAGAANGTIGDDVTLDLSLSTFDTKIRVFEGSCAALVCVEGNDDGGTGTTSLLTFTTTVGTEYFVLVHGYLANAGDYTLDVSCTPPPTCTAATLEYTTVSNCDVSESFFLDVTVTSMGSATDLTITNDQDGASFAVTSAPTTVQFGPYANGTDVIVTTDDDNDDGTCTVTSDAITQSACPPDNTLCSTAEDVTVGVGEDGPTVVGTNLNASDSGVGDPSCNAFYEGGDIWYAFTPPVGAVEVTLDVASSAFSSIIAVVYDNCTDLNEIYCQTIFSSSASFNITGITGGTTYYLRLYDFGNDSIGDITFNINTPTLGVDNFEISGFTYFPNPVNNELTLKAQSNIQNVAVYNMLGQEVLRTAPNAIESNVDMNGLAQGAYFVKVTINNSTETIRIIKN